LTTLYLAGVKNTDSWHSKKGNFQQATPLDISMVPSSSVAITTDGECPACSGFSLGEPIHLENFEFITDYFDGLSLSPRSVPVRVPGSAGGSGSEARLGVIVRGVVTTTLMVT
jgi:hypothetical protein